MKLCFDSIEEVKEFVGNLKGTRGGRKGEPDEAGEGKSAPAPMLPPTGTGGQAGFPGAGSTGFAPPAGGATQAGAGPFAPGAPAVAPEVAALVTRISTRIEGAVASGQPADAVLQWFRGQCGAEAANATIEQIKTVFLPKLALPALENIAKLMNA